MKKIRVCNSRACSSFGAKRIMNTLTRQTRLMPGEKNEQYDLDYCGCLGWCSNAPNIEVDDHRILFDVEADEALEKANSDRTDADPSDGKDNSGGEIDVDKLFETLS